MKVNSKVVDMKFDAEDKAGMTIDELEEVVKACREAGLDGGHQLYAWTNLKGKVKSLRTQA